METKTRKIEILGKTIGKIYVKECLGGNPIEYLCVCPCGDTFTAVSQRIRNKNTDCGCGIVTGIHNKPFKVGDTYQGCKILEVSKKYAGQYKGQTCYSFLCKCGKKAERTHADFRKRPGCRKCIKEQSDAERDKKIEDEFVGKKINGIKILRLSGRDEKSQLRVDAVCPICGKEFSTLLSRIKTGIDSCAECARANLDEGQEIAKSAWVEGTSILSITPDRALNKNSTTGHKGVSRYANGRYRAYITFKRKQYHLGQFDTLEEAIEARQTAEKKIFGDFIKWYAEEYPERWAKINKNGNKEP